MGGEIIPGRTVDDEAGAILDELSDLQTWCILSQVSGSIAAADLVQRTRILIIERCKRKSNVRDLKREGEQA